MEAAIVSQENSYYPFGLTMPGNYTVNNPANNNLYNSGSEWQNDFSGLPEYYSTFYRNYDPALGRFIAVDPKTDATDDLSSYHYAGNNPILFNDPLGDRYQRVDIMNRGYLKPFSPKLAFDRSEGGYSPGAGGMYSPNQAEAYRRELEKANGLNSEGSYTKQGLASIIGQIPSLRDGNYNGSDLLGASLPEVIYTDIRQGSTPIWWGNTQNFINRSLSYLTSSEGLNPNIGGVNLFGSTYTDQRGAEIKIINSEYSDKLIFKYYGGKKAGKEGIFNINITNFNNDDLSQDYSINLGIASASVNLKELNINVGFSLFGYGISQGTSLLGGQSFGISYTDSKNNIIGIDGSYRLGGYSGLVGLSIIGAVEFVPVATAVLAH